MAEITFKGTPVSTNGALPKVGDTAPAFTLVDKSLVEKSLSDFAGVQKILTINPSYDTGVCQATARHFNKAVAGREGVAVLTISADLPFAHNQRDSATFAGFLLKFPCHFVCLVMHQEHARESRAALPEWPRSLRHQGGAPHQ